MHEAIANERFEEASQIIVSRSEADLVECFEGMDGCSKSSLHLIAAISDTEEATKLCRQLMQKIKNTLNRECLLNGRTVEELDTGGRKVQACVSAIHIAAYSGNAGVVTLLCQDCGVDVNCSSSETLEERPKKGITPLEWAARRGNAEAVKVLLDNKANVNASRTNDGATALHIAAHEGHVEVLKMLLENKADVNASLADNGSTALYVAAEKGHVEVVRMLLEMKANVNASRTDDGATALYMAAQQGHVEVVKALLDNKANVNASRTNGEKPIEAARRNHHVDVVKLLQ